MEVIKTNDYEEMSRIAAKIIIEKVSGSKKVNLGLATGSTTEGLYRCLIDDYRNNNTSYRHVSTFNLDEYVGMKPDNVNSYHYYMNSKLFDHIDFLPSNNHLPNGTAENLLVECCEYESLIEKKGGIDLQILGIGENGHIGFNEPNTPFPSETHIVDLSPSTREANSRFFHDCILVPKQAITMGISTICKSKEILLLVSGEKKAEALQRLLHSDVSQDFPASILKLHPKVTVITDRALCERI
jgi:glucosamine-6-phosphate deaminase